MFDSQVEARWVPAFLREIAMGLLGGFDSMRYWRCWLNKEAVVCDAFP